MKKQILIITFIILMSILVNGQEKESITTPTAISPDNLSNSFMTAFGMKVETAEDIDNKTPDPSIEPDINTTPIGMSIISTSAVNQVTPPFTPHIPK
ncbi:hypothetical protein NRK67_01205 [Fusobacteria bacterium ZRK30]|nr:hypothetical protein NRK67_01205 [Fusobacteria bacterium ZRK30]